MVLDAIPEETLHGLYRTMEVHGRKALMMNDGRATFARDGNSVPHPYPERVSGRDLLAIALYEIANSERPMDVVLPGAAWLALEDAGLLAKLHVTARTTIEINPDTPYTMGWWRSSGRWHVCSTTARKICHDGKYVVPMKCPDDVRAAYRAAMRDTNAPTADRRQAVAYA